MFVGDSAGVELRLMLGLSKAFGRVFLKSSVGGRAGHAAQVVSPAFFADLRFLKLGCPVETPSKRRFCGVLKLSK